MRPAVPGTILPGRINTKERHMPVYARLVVTLACLAASHAAMASPGGNSAATISATFADSCRGFVAHSSKDISHVVLHYADGRVVKDESIASPDYAIEGAAGDELEFAIVKSGTSRNLFECVRDNPAPVARLEILTPAEGTIEGCFDFWAGGLVCEQSTPRVAWTSTARIPDDGGDSSGLFGWICGNLTGPSLCSYTVTFRGISSVDPGGDIVSWSLDYGDGTSTGGSWGSNPPAEVAHDYSGGGCLGVFGLCVITLTVIDAAGQSGSVSMGMYFLDVSPD
jgi:hypothetical protein